jgi:hypothetical protein
MLRNQSILDAEYIDYRSAQLAWLEHNVNVRNHIVPVDKDPFDVMLGRG